MPYYPPGGGSAAATTKSAFFAYLNVTENNVTGDGTIYVLGGSNALVKIFDLNGDFNTNGTFTAPVAGKYQFNCQFLLQNTIVTNQITLQVATTIMTYTLGNSSGEPAAGNNPVSVSVLVTMSANDTAKVQIIAGAGTKTVHVYGGTNDPRSSFSGFLAY